MALTNIFNEYSPSRGKIGEGITHHYPPEKDNVENVIESLNNIRKELTNYYHSYNSNCTIVIIEKLEYILNTHLNWIKSEKLLHNKDAEIFHDAFSLLEEELIVQLEDIDKNYER